MRILILGGGLMGPAAAFNAISDPDVSQVVVCDSSQRQLDGCASKLAGFEGTEKISTILLDLNDQAAAAKLMSDFDVAVGALPQSVNVLGIRAAIQVNTPLVDLARLDRSELPKLRREVEAVGGLVVPGCGLEPGLTEIMARYLAEKLDQVDELHIQCGGVQKSLPHPWATKSSSAGGNCHCGRGMRSSSRTESSSPWPVTPAWSRPSSPMWASAKPGTRGLCPG